MIYGRQRGLAGLALEIVDGGTLQNVEVSKIKIDGVSVAIFLRLGNRGRVYEPGGGNGTQDGRVFRILRGAVEA